MGPREHRQPALGQGGRDGGAVLEGHLVAVALQDQGGGGDRGQRGQVERGLGGQHPHRLGVDHREVVRAVR
jgi:hypothetical protein